ncbi:hypothetical protein [Nocardia concava]|uniref:hypothetical protein n=1 Tax=Nocardia concava TaxID=257281 RepID=UPI0012FB1CE7|nr:hypothetical protein [Nocardia concava]
MSSAKVRRVEFSSLAGRFTISIERTAGLPAGLHITRNVCNAVAGVCFAAGVVAILAGVYTGAGTGLQVIGVGLWVGTLVARIGVFAISRSRTGHAE